MPGGGDSCVRVSGGRGPARGPSARKRSTRRGGCGSGKDWAVTARRRDSRAEAMGDAGFGPAARRGDDGFVDLRSPRASCITAANGARNVGPPRRLLRVARGGGPGGDRRAGARRDGSTQHGARLRPGARRRAGRRARRRGRRAHDAPPGTAPPLGPMLKCDVVAARRRCTCFPAPATSLGIPQGPSSSGP